MRVEPCACGGFISATPNDETLVLFAVQRHNGTARHAEWRQRREVAS